MIEKHAQKENAGLTETLKYDFLGDFPIRMDGHPHAVLERKKSP